MALVEQAQERWFTMDASGGSRLDIPKMEKVRLDAAMISIPVLRSPLTSEGYAGAAEAARKSIEDIRRLVDARTPQFGLALVPQDAYSLEKRNKIAIFLSLSDGYAIGRDLALLKTFHDLGIRCLALCGGTGNEICSPASASSISPAADRGLSELGRKVVAECNRLGLIIDVTGVSDKTFFDVLAVSRAPVIASHSASRALCRHPLNLTDDMIRALAGHDGVICVPFTADQLVKDRRDLRGRAGSSAPASVIVDHIEQILRISGSEHVGIGTGLALIPGSEISLLPIEVTYELLRRGYEEIRMEEIMGRNFMRVFEGTIRASLSAID